MNRGAIAFMLGMVGGAICYGKFPFPADDVVLQVIRELRPGLFHCFHVSWGVMMFTTPWLVFSLAVSLGFVFAPKRGKAKPGKLPPLPKLRTLGVIIGEVHHQRVIGPAEFPHWLTIGARGLYCGTFVLGAIGSGKTTAAMRPFATQILGFGASDKKRRAAGMILEVKGDFCDQVKEILTAAGRAEDYIEVGLQSDYVYNPLNKDQDAFSLAYSIASLLNNLYGRGKEPFWQQAYTNLVKFVILLHQVTDGYCTLRDIYLCAISPKILQDKIKQGDEAFEALAESITWLIIDPMVYMGHEELEGWTWETDEGGKMRTEASDDLVKLLDDRRVPYDVIEPPPLPAGFEDRAEKFGAVKRWFTHDWMGIDTKLRTSVVEGISVFLSLFDGDPGLRRRFCPPRQAFDPVANADGRYGVPLPEMGELLEQGKVLALNFPMSANTATARTIGAMLKLDFQKAMLDRIPRMAKDPKGVYRPVMFLCDEYQAFATVGENDPTGDEKFFALSRQGLCIPIVATQSISSLRSTLGGESWRTLLQTFRTKIFLCLSDEFSAKAASDLCGWDEQKTVGMSISESGHDARVGLLAGKAQAHKAGLTVNKTISLQRRPIFESRVFMELKNSEAIVLAYDGVNPLPAQLCYLKPHYNDPNVSYFDQVEAGLL